MDLDTNGPLNDAHRHERQAEDDEKKNLFDSAVQQRLQAIHSFNESLQLTNNPQAKEAINAQISSNMLSIEDLKRKKERRSQEVVEERIRQKSLSEFKADSPNVPRKSDKSSPGDRLETEIYRVIEEHDSLLQLLSERGQNPDSNTASTSTLSGSAYKSGNKVPKGDKTVIEELKVSNEQLRQLVHQLFGELEKTQLEKKLLEKEVESLKLKLSNQGEECSLSSLPPLPQPPFNIIY